MKPVTDVARAGLAVPPRWAGEVPEIVGQRWSPLEERHLRLRP